MHPQNQKRILLVDDNTSIHSDFRKVLGDASENTRVKAIKDELFGGDNAVQGRHTVDRSHFDIDSAYQGQEALELVKKSVHDKKPYSLAIVDIRMPPGWDGIVTIQKLWEVDPDIQVVICTAYSDYTWEEISQQLNYSDNFLILKKPFDVVEIRQLAASLTKKWLLNKQLQYQIENLQSLVSERTADLDKIYSLTKATLESTQEGIIAISRDKQVTTYNKRFLNLWGLNEDILKNERAEFVFQELASQMEDSNLFLTTIDNLCQHEKPANVRIWKNNKGDTYELYAQSQYLHKDIVGTVFSFRDITLQKKLEEQLLYQATHDALTGLPNRILLVDRLQQALAAAKHRGEQVALLFIDMDNFKQVNDTLGHNAGDMFLKSVANKLHACVASGNTVTRLGGDEFVIVMAELVTEESVTQLATNILKILYETYEFNGADIVSSASIGISMFPKDGIDADTLLKNADTALYFAKESAKNSSKFFINELNEKIMQRMELSSALRHAFDRHEFFIEYQPLSDLKSSHIIGVEALIRWRHPTLGVLLPETFIPVAEENGMIVTIGEWALRTACTEVRKWQQQGLPSLRLAIVVFEKEIKQATFINTVKQVLADTQFSPHSLEFEVAENLMVHDQVDLLNKMLTLKELGVRLTMSNFWEGYTSFMRMKNMPFESLKIEKHFIDNLILDENDAYMVDVIINMMSKMGISVFADGVDKKEQIEFLQKNHINHVQGYYSGLPMSKEACAAFLEKVSVKEEP